MRALLPILVCSACLVTPPPRSDDTTAEAPPSDTTSKAPPKRPEPPPPPEPFVPPPAPEGLQGVDVVGHGLRITVYPPFQISLADDFVANFTEEDASGGLIVSWWNVADPKVGGRTGFGALYNIGVAAHPAPEGAEIVRQERTWPNGKKGIAYRLGETGSYVLLPPELLDVGGMLTVATGPAEPVWSMEVDGVRTPLESPKIVHSADPAQGAPFVLDGKPHKPWGPWKE